MTFLDGCMIFAGFALGWQLRGWLADAKERCFRDMGTENREKYFRDGRID